VSEHQQRDDLADAEEKGLNGALMAIIGWPILIFVVSMVVWAVAQALT